MSKQKNGRVYKVDKRHIELPAAIFSKFAEWGDEPHKNDKDCDKRLVSALALACLNEEQLRKEDVNKEVVEFIQGNFVNFDFYNISPVTIHF